MTNKQSVKIWSPYMATFSGHLNDTATLSSPNDLFVAKSDYDLLLQELKDYREALEFYAEPSSWRKYPNDMQADLIIESDVADYPHVTRDVRLTGGKLARAALSKAKGRK